jgi:hypothetical protein
MRIERLTTIPPSDRTATSVCRPDVDDQRAEGSDRNPAPIAAAIGSSSSGPSGRRR